MNKLINETARRCVSLTLEKEEAATNDVEALLEEVFKEVAAQAFKDGFNACANDVQANRGNV